MKTEPELDIQTSQELSPILTMQADDPSPGPRHGPALLEAAAVAHLTGAVRRPQVRPHPRTRP